MNMDGKDQTLFGVTSYSNIILRITKRKINKLEDQQLVYSVCKVMETIRDKLAMKVYSLKLILKEVVRMEINQKMKQKIHQF